MKKVGILAVKEDAKPSKSGNKVVLVIFI